MNFFLPSGNLNTASAKLERSKVEVAETRSIHSSADDLDKDKDIGKLQSPPRREKVLGTKNRKHNKDFRSVWYDAEDEEEEEIQPTTLKSSGLKKTTSFEDLLDIGKNWSRPRHAVKKNMISSPIKPRKIVGDWSFDKKIDETEIQILDRKLSVTVAAPAVEYFSQISKETSSFSTNALPEIKTIQPDTNYDSNQVSNIKKEDTDTSMVYVNEEQKEMTLKDENHPLAHIEDAVQNEGTSDVQNMAETYNREEDQYLENKDVNTEAKPVVESFSFPLESSTISSGQEKDDPDVLNATQLQDSDSKTDTKEIEGTSEQTNPVSKLGTLEEDKVCDVQKKDLSSRDLPDFSSEVNVLRQSSFCTSTNRDSGPEVMELQIFQQPLLPAPCEVAVEATPVSTGNEKHFKKHSGTLESKSKLKRGRKIEISPPTAPKIMLGSGDQLDMTDLDNEGVTNLLRMKSKSTSDLLKSFNQIKNEKTEPLNNPKFPIPETNETEDDIQIRRHQNINQYRYSKTTDFDFGRKRQDTSKDFETKGLTKMVISSDTTPIKLRKGGTLRYQNGHFYEIDDKSNRVLKANVTLKSARLLNKRDVELKDANNISYVLCFDSSKDAKLFLEKDSLRCFTENDNKSTITKTLLRLLGKRSSREMLERKGIYQNEPIFGNTLRNIYNTEKGVPHFILRTMEYIEKPENITSLGLYRTSGNLATIQKIRFEVDKGRLSILNEYSKDVDVLTGCLKLFFRELKEPLIPCDVCDSLLRVTKIGNYSKKEREQIRQAIMKLPEANSETLYVLIRHLIKVVLYKDENKMDTYNLSVCWGPTIIFMTDLTTSALMKDPVAQTADAARVFDALLTFYIDHPEELELIKRNHDYLDTNRNPIQRQDSKESVRSIDSNTSKSQKRSDSNQSLNIDEVLKKSVELIEMNIKSEGLYKKSGSTERINKIVKRMMKKKVSELERHKFDTNDLTDSLKKYLREMPEILVMQECVEQVNKICDAGPCLESNNRQKIISAVENLPKKDTLIFLLKHIIKVMHHEHQHNVSKADMISIWTNMLNYQKRVVDSNEKFSRFLTAVLEVFDETKVDIMPSPKNFSNGLLNDLKNYQKDKDRISKYDNVPELEGHAFKEATILEEKTEEAEYTKL